MPKVSVIVPVYNSERYIRECVDSILSQSFQDYELILVDDGSTDGCGEIIDGYAARDSRVRAVHQKNGGPSAARNAGLDAASGRYVYFADSDDILDAQLLETVIPRMDEGYDMVVFGFRIIPAPDKKERENMAYTVRQETKVILDDDEKKAEFIAGPFRRRSIRWEPWNRVFRREIIEERQIRFGYDRRVFAEDMYFTYFYVAHASRILLLPECLYTYRKHEGSVSAGFQNHLMIYSSNRMTELFYEHCRACDDCRYLYDHFLPIYYLLHKGAVRRLRRYQWKNGLSMDKAREILRGSVVDYPVFIERMTQMYGAPAVVESYKKDKHPFLQLTDRLYTGELLDLPASGIKKGVRRTALAILRAVSTR